jgi:O-antigen ligase
LGVLAAIQGEGIADLVNHYFEILLASGVLGLALFCGAFARALQVVWQGLRHKSVSQERKLLGTALFCTVLSMLATISTVSNITAVPVILWSVLGMCSAYSTLEREPSQKPTDLSGRVLSHLFANNR